MKMELSKRESDLIEAMRALKAGDKPSDSSGLLGAARIVNERIRQLDEEGWTPEHDDEHRDGAMTEAALCYGTVAGAQSRGSGIEEWPVSMFDGFNDSIVHWPWEEEWYKPAADVLRNLDKTGGLIASEIDRIERARRRLQFGGPVPV